MLLWFESFSFFNFHPVLLFSHLTNQKRFLKNQTKTQNHDSFLLEEQQRRLKAINLVKNKANAQ